MVMSTPEEMKLPLRHIALLYGRVDLDLAITSGIHSGIDGARAVLAGANGVQTASSLLKNGIPYLSTMLRELEGWMEEKDYQKLDDIRGSLSQREHDHPYAFERTQYVNLALQSEVTAKHHI